MKKLYSLLFLFTSAMFSAMHVDAQVNISNGTDTICVNTLFDSGGAGGDYGNSEDLTYVISPTGVDSVVMTFDSISLNTGDILRFFDGADTNASLLFTVSDTTTILPSFIASGSNMTLHFGSDGSGVDYGWSIQWYSVLTTAPSVSITTSGNSICNTDVVTFTVSDSTGGGFDPVFQWFKNSGMVGGDSNVYHASGLADQDTIWVEMTQSSCPQAMYQVISSKEVISVTNNVTASVSLSADTVVCSTDTVLFTATPTNGGGSPVYSWTINGSPVGSNSPTFSAAVSDLDSVNVQMASSIATGCLIDSISNDWVTMDVTSSVIASVSISATDTNICDSTVVTFTAAPTNGGASPTYAWTVNGSPVGSNSPTYIDSTFSNGDIVKVTMASDLSTACLVDSISSDSTEMVVTGNITASVSLTVDDVSVCAGESQLFTATPTNGGASPTYTWRINGSPIVNSSATYSTSSLSNGDNVAVTMASDIGSGCLIDSISSDSLDVVINPNPVASISDSSNILCYSDATGWAKVSVSSGTGTIAYLWSDAQAVDSAVNLVAGTYWVRTTDDSSCFDTAYVTLTEGSQMNISFSISHVTTFGGSDGSVSATGSGGNPYTGGQSGYFHYWDYNNITNAPQKDYTHMIGSLAAGSYRDSIIDQDGCYTIATAVVTQPGQLVPGAIRINGSTSKNICAGDIIGNMTNNTAASGGQGTLAYLWQYSVDLLSWDSLQSSNSSSYNWNDTLSEITFVRRSVSDSTGDTAYSNILFLNYIARTSLNVIGLDSVYCSADDPVSLFGSPSSPGTGWFSQSAYMDSAMNSFSPGNAPTGVNSPIAYNYDDAYGCPNKKTFYSKVYETDTGSVWLENNQFVFSPSEGPVKLYSTYPGGSFSGPGVSQVADTFYFTASSVVGTLPINVSINFNYTNGNGCVSTDTVKAIIQNSEVSIYSGVADTSLWGGCYHKNADHIYAVIPSGVTVNSFRWYTYYFDGSSNKFNVPGNLVFTDTLVNNDTIFWNYDPKMFLPAGGGGAPYDSVKPTPAGITNLTVVFQYYDTTVSPYTNSVFDANFELVNLTSVKINPNKPNSNGSTGNPLQYCETVTSVGFGTSVFPIGGRTFTKQFVPLSGLTDNGNGMALFDPSVLGPADTTLIFEYTDVKTGCTVDTVYQLTVDALPSLTINTIPDSSCANDPVINFTGSPYIASKGFFTSPTAALLNLNQAGANASITPSPNNDNMTHNISYFFTDVTGCADTITDTIKINPIPSLSIRRTGFPSPTDSLVHCFGDVASYDKLLNLAPDPNPNATLIGTGFLDSLSNSYTANTVGFHTVTYSSTDNKGCSNSVDTVIQVRAIPDASFTMSDSVVCDYATDTVSLSANFTGGVLQQWDFYSTTQSGATANFIIGNGNSGASNVVQFKTDDGSTWGCLDSTTQSIYINDLPTVNISSLSGDYCVDQSVDVVNGSPASLGFSFFRSYQIKNGNRVYNNFANSGLLSAGVSSTGINPTDVDSNLVDDTVYVDYVHVDANGCLNYATDSTELHDLPILNITATGLDFAICDDGTDVVNLQGRIDINGSFTSVNGNFYTMNPIVQDTFLTQSAADITNGVATYGNSGFSINSFRTDSIYFKHTDVHGCFDSVFSAVEIVQLPPSNMTVVPGVNPNSAIDVCVDGSGEVTPFFNPTDCPSCYTNWPNTDHSWQVLDTLNDSTFSTSWVTATTQSIFEPASDPHIVNGINYLRYTVTDITTNHGCVSRDTATFFVNPLPEPQVWVDSSILSGSQGVVCSNLGNNLLVNLSPASSGHSNDMVFSSNMYGGFSSPLSNGQSTVTLSTTGLTQVNVDPFTNLFTIEYSYLDTNTYCRNSSASNFTLKTAPKLSYNTTGALTGKSVFCPYDAAEMIQLRVHNESKFVDSSNASDTTINRFYGMNIDSINSNEFVTFYPNQFADSIKHTPVWPWVHTDIDGCSDTTNITGYTINNKPVNRILILPGTDSICFNDAPFIIRAQYKDTATWNWKNYTNLTGKTTSANQSYFEFERTSSGFLPPSLGPQEYRFDPPNDSKDGLSAVVTRVAFASTYIDSAGGSGCYDYDTAQIATRPKPVAAFSLDGQCSKYAPVLRGDSSSINNNPFDPSDGIASYEWTIDGQTGTATPSNQVIYTHDTILSVGLHTFGLSVTSNKGCVSEDSIANYQFVESPDANFNWNMDGECLGTAVTFNSTSEVPNGADVTYSWYYGDGGLDTNLADSVTSTTHTYASAQAFNVLLEVEDAGNCLDSITKTIYIRDWVNNYPYIDSFQTAYTGWAVWQDEYDDENQEFATRDPSWFVWGQRPQFHPDSVFSHVDTITMDSIYVDSVRTNVFSQDGDYGWYLDYHFDRILSSSGLVDSLVFRYDNDIQTSVIGPCFDLTSTDRPMITMNSIHNMEGSDGVVVQYTTDVGKPLSEVTWQNVGDFRTDNQNNHVLTGIDWYNKQNIFGNPGKQTDLQGKIGFTDLSNPDSTDILNIIPEWYESRNDINEVRKLPYVRFRVAMGSNADAKGEGYIFDDFGIRERKKNIVFESFVNNKRNNFYADIVKHDSQVVYPSRDIIDIQYHTAFPEPDPLNRDNITDPGSRSLYYGISEVPYVQGDGNQFSDFMSSSNYGSFTLQARALEDPKFGVHMWYDPANESIRTVIACNDEEFLTSSVDVTVQIALLEKEIILGSGVASNFNGYPARNTLKRLIPNAAGTNFNGMIKGDVDTLTYDLPIENFYGSADSLKVVAFVQNRKTKEIYQANWVDFIKQQTGDEEYEEIVENGVEYNLYPNPTTGFTTMDFKEDLKSNYTMTIYNQLGAVVYQEVVAEGSNRHTFDINGLKAGMYFIMLNNGTHEVAIKKLMLTN